ncbi:MAG: carbohydrate ABC transporter permease [Spirochaetaceae bacterium]|jgi:raffinose/stachyose/melibiose transport system permease protein|nr:carbohydrate ABC transporter permease [Spirochaetaceae bacterium]
MNKTAINAGRTAGGIILNVFILAFSLLSIFPFVWMLYSSLKTEAEFALNIISLPQKPIFSNYINAIRTGHMGEYALNSLFNCVITVVLVAFATYIVAYFLSRYNFKGRTLVYGLFVAGMLIPVHSLMVPIFVEYRVAGLLNSRLTLLPVYLSFGMPMAVFLIESFIGSIPIELEEAALIDGSSMVRTMFTIIMPLCRPVLATVVILTFMNTWNEFPFALVLIRDNALKTIPIGLRNFQGAYTAQYTQFMAGMAVSLIPVMVVYILFYKRIIVGMTAGTVKG